MPKCKNCGKIHHRHIYFKINGKRYYRTEYLSYCKDCQKEVTKSVKEVLGINNIPPPKPVRDGICQCEKVK